MIIFKAEYTDGSEIEIYNPCGGCGTDDEIWIAAYYKAITAAPKSFQV